MWLFYQFAEIALREHSIIKIVILRFMTLIYNTNNESTP
jgi:hypothetical protein